MKSKEAKENTDWPPVELHFRMPYREGDVLVYLETSCLRRIVDDHEEMPRIVFKMTRDVIELRSKRVLSRLPEATIRISQKEDDDEKVEDLFDRRDWIGFLLKKFLEENGIEDFQEVHVLEPAWAIPDSSLWPCYSVRKQALRQEVANAIQTSKESPAFWHRSSISWEKDERFETIEDFIKAECKRWPDNYIGYCERVVGKDRTLGNLFSVNLSCFEAPLDPGEAVSRAREAAENLDDERIWDFFATRDEKGRLSGSIFDVKEVEDAFFEAFTVAKRHMKSVVPYHLDKVHLTMCDVFDITGKHWREFREG